MTFDMQKARELREATRTTIIKTLPGQTGYGIDHSKYPDFKAMQEVCSAMFPAALDRIVELEKEVAEKDAYINDDSNARLNLAMVNRIVELENDKRLFDQTFAGNCFELMKQLVGHGAYFPEPGDAKILRRILDYLAGLHQYDCPQFTEESKREHEEVLKRYLRTMK